MIKQIAPRFIPTKKGQLITAPKKNGGGSANTNICATNKVWWV